MRKVLAIFLILGILFVLVGCSDSGNSSYSSSSYKSTAATSSQKSEVLNQPSGQDCVNVYTNDGELYLRGDHMCPTGEKCYTISKDQYHCDPPAALGYGCDGVCK